MPGVRGKSGGRRANSGRKSKAEELSREDFWKGTVTDEKRKEIAEHLCDIATGADLKAAVSAASLLFGYMFGKPTEKHVHSGDENSPITLKVVYDSRS